MSARRELNPHGEEAQAMPAPSRTMAKDAVGAGLILQDAVLRTAPQDEEQARYERRKFLAVLGSAAAAWPLAARGQQVGPMRRVGILLPYPSDDPVAKSALAVFARAFQDLGWVDGRNVRLDVRWADGSFERMQSLAKELVTLQPDVILASNGAPATRALVQVTSTIPIVFTGASDPVGLGFVESLTHPGGNVTGFSLYESSLGTKWLEGLKRIAPGVKRISLIFNPETSVPGLYLPAIEAAAAALAVELHQHPVLDAKAIEAAIADLSKEPGGGLMLLPDTFLITHREMIVAWAASYKVPAIYPIREFTAAGGLMSYGVELEDLSRRAAAYVDRILRGAKPADLPVQQPTKFELTINLKSAKALGLTVPDTLLALADEVIE
jgi:putative tryptophan/tyrosine transport system substrate-binding protein